MISWHMINHETQWIILRWRKSGSTLTLPRTNRPSKNDVKMRRYLILEGRFNGLNNSQYWLNASGFCWRKLKTKRNFSFQCDNDPKHTSKSTKEWLDQKKYLCFGMAEPEPRTWIWYKIWQMWSKEEWTNITEAECSNIITYSRCFSKVLVKAGVSD